MMQKAGYATACAGKWQLTGDGITAEMTGFDETCMWAYGFDLEPVGFELKKPKGTKGNYYFKTADPSQRYNVVFDLERPHMTSRYWYPCILRNGDLVPSSFSDFGPDICSDFVCDFIDRHQEEAFFIYYPMILTHAPNVPSPKTPGVEKMSNTEKLKNDKANFKYLVEYADLIVGNIIDKLEEHGLRDNTIVMFTGDNGTLPGIETKMRDGSVIVGGKGETTNGGTHVPLIAGWTGRFNGGTVCEDLIDFSDFMTTIADATGAELPTGPGIALDGHSFAPQICGKKPGKKREWVFCHYDKNPASAAANPKFPRARYARDKKHKLYDNGRLYDVVNDVLEKKIIPTNPENSQAERARENLQKVLDSMPVKRDFYTQGGVTRENNLAPTGSADNSKNTIDPESEAAILELKKERKQLEKKSKEWNELTEQILRLQ